MIRRWKLIIAFLLILYWRSELILAVPILGYVNGCCCTTTTTTTTTTANGVGCYCCLGSIDGANLYCRISGLTGACSGYNGTYIVPPTFACGWQYNAGGITIAISVGGDPNPPGTNCIALASINITSIPPGYFTSYSSPSTTPNSVTCDTLLGSMTVTSGGTACGGTPFTAVFSTS